MKFIECHEEKTNIRVLIPYDKILSICENDDGTAFIETHIDIDGNGVGFNTKEFYAQLVLKLKMLN